MNNIEAYVQPTLLMACPPQPVPRITTLSFFVADNVSVSPGFSGRFISAGFLNKRPTCMNASSAVSMERSKNARTSSEFTCVHQRTIAFIIHKIILLAA